MRGQNLSTPSGPAAYRQAKLVSAATAARKTVAKLCATSAFAQYLAIAECQPTQILPYNKNQLGHGRRIVMQRNPEAGAVNPPGAVMAR